VSSRDYDELQRSEVIASAVEELDGATLKELAKSQMDARHDHLNAMLG
jgi:hypothetical protein